MGEKESYVITYYCSDTSEVPKLVFRVVNKKLQFSVIQLLPWPWPSFAVAFKGSQVMILK